MQITSVLIRPRLTVLVLILLGAVTAGAAADKSQPTAQEKKYVRPSDLSLYVGSETCRTCHEDMPSKGFYKSYEDSRHFVTTLDTKRGPEWHGCEACHGPGKEHVEGGGDKSKIFSFKSATARESSERCLDCRGFGEEHSNFLRSEHLKNNVGCIDCHSPHHPKVPEHLLKAAQPELCFTCHLEVKPDFSKAFHHRVNEGLIACSNYSGHGLFQLPYGQGGPLRFRAWSGENRRLRGLPYPARFVQPAPAQAQPDQPALPRMPHIDGGFRRASDPLLPQPGAEVSSLHHVPRGNSRLEF